MFKAVIAGYSRSPFTMARKGELVDVKPVIGSVTSKNNGTTVDIEGFL